jgi:phospholipid/cholesterol/gamma-HCH transport system substrate-binding protein
MKRVVAFGLVAAAIIGGAAWVLTDHSYRVRVVLASATNVVEGGTVLMRGMEVGQIDDIEAQDGKALLELELDGDYAPLHDGAVVTVTWKALLGERRISIADGPSSNPTIPDGGVVRGKHPQPMELDQILNALDKPTRTRLASMIHRLDQTLDHNQSSVRSTLLSLGPALKSLGELLRAADTDGPAIRNVVSRLNGLMTLLARRDHDMRGVIDDLSTLTTRTASKRQHLRSALRALPPTLDQATETLGAVPATAREVSPMLRDLGKATSQLPAVARNLKPVLTDLRPMVANLRPTLSAARQLLGDTPEFLDMAHSVLPGATDALTDVQPALRFLRPYTPELMGWLSTWGSAAANYDSNGHYWRVNIQGSGTSLNVNPGVVPPGMESKPYPLPGENIGQPWTDAFGGGQR